MLQGVAWVELRHFSTYISKELLLIAAAVRLLTNNWLTLWFIKIWTEGQNLSQFIEVFWLMPHVTVNHNWLVGVTSIKHSSILSTCSSYHPHSVTKKVSVSLCLVVRGVKESTTPRPLSIPCVGVFLSVCACVGGVCVLAWWCPSLRMSSTHHGPVCAA